MPADDFSNSFGNTVGAFASFCPLFSIEALLGVKICVSFNVPLLPGTTYEAEMGVGANEDSSMSASNWDDIAGDA